MIFGIGVDICENHRIEKLFLKYGHTFLNKIFTHDEISYCLGKKSPVPHLAARFALKEAFIKALKYNAPCYKEIGLSGSSGVKLPQTFGKIHKAIQEKKISNIECSISHAQSHSVAMVVLEYES
jgi:holo-[acyl-carrier protein] synthase